MTELLVPAGTTRRRARSMKIPPAHPVVAKPTMLMKHDVAPADVIREAIGDLSEITLSGNRLLIGVYQRPEQLASGLYISDGTRKEDEYQGKSGLVLKKGPSAFVSDSHYDFNGFNVDVGEWVAIWVLDGRSVKVKGILCRVVEDFHIWMKIASPDIVY